MLAPQQMPMGGPQISPDMIEKAKRILETPSWEEISAIFRSDERRNYKISVSTDALNEEDDVEYKEQVLEFGKTMVELMQAVVPGVQQNPSLAPFSRELVMAVVKAFKVGRPLEEALEDGLNQIQNQPAPQQPNPEVIKAQAEVQKAQSEAKVAEMRVQMESQKMQAEIADAQAQRQLDAAKHESDAQLKAADLQLTHQQKMAALENTRLQTLLQLQKLGIDNRKQALEEWEASGRGIDLHERRAADTADQQAQTMLQAHDQLNKHAIEHRKIDAQREATATQAATAAQTANQKAKAAQ